MKAIMHQVSVRIKSGILVQCLVLCAATAVRLPAQTYNTVYNFSAPGEQALGLTQATDGNIYGVSLGTVFKFTLGLILTILHTFDGTDGSFPYGTLVQIGNGDLYGTTEQGGASNYGTIFKVTTAGAFTSLYSFSNTTDGGDPVARLVQAANGDLYGVANLGPLGFGTVFKITQSGEFTTVHTFNGPDGSQPNALIRAANGYFYGTTGSGGAGNYGTVFKMTPGGTLTTLYSFANTTDGAYPSAALVQGLDGDFYGTTAGDSGLGTIFRISPAGELTTLHTFDGTDGAYVDTGLTLGSDGNFYGTATSGGPGYSQGTLSGGGTIFEITPAGTFTTLHAFCGFQCDDGLNPGAGLVQDTDGTFYGTTTSGGIGVGTIFDLSVGLAPFVRAQPGVGVPGEIIRILGTDFTQTTSVMFNGKPAVFAKISPVLLLAQVPAGASTGNIQVVTFSGTLSSNVPFRVR